MNSTPKKFLSWILLGSLVVTLAYSFVFQIDPTVDASRYDIIALNLIDGVGFVEEPGLSIQDDRAIVRVGPLYQFFLVGIYKVFGHSFAAVWIIQALLHVLSAFIIYHLSIIIFNKNKETIALWATGIFAFYPDLIEISAMLLTETLYLFLWIVFIYLFIWYIDRTAPSEAGFVGWLRNLSEFIRTKVHEVRLRNEWFWIVILALISGLAVLARPPVLFVLPLVFFYLWSRKRIKLSILYAFILILVFAPWTIRNYVTFDRIMPFGGAGNYNFWIGNHDGANGEQETGPEIAAFLTENGALALYDESIPRFVEFVKNNPLEFTKLTILRTNRYFSIIRPMGFWFYDSGWSQFAFIMSSVVASVFLFVFSFYGILKLWLDRNLKHNYLLWMIILTPLILFITVVETRYRFQIYPLLALFAGYGIVSLIGNRNFIRDRALWLSLLVVFGNGILDTLLSLEKLKERLGMFF
jgi:4-amino-4-deoxy-L-arabinose transferase-like glycosyltransferase